MAAKRNEFFDGLRDALQEGVEAVRKGKNLVTRKVTLPRQPAEKRGQTRISGNAK
jgi:hypothetical protein